MIRTLSKWPDDSFRNHYSFAYHLLSPGLPPLFPDRLKTPKKTTTPPQVSVPCLSNANNVPRSLNLFLHKIDTPNSVIPQCPKSPHHRSRALATPRASSPLAQKSSTSYHRPTIPQARRLLFRLTSPDLTLRPPKSNHSRLLQSVRSW